MITLVDDNWQSRKFIDDFVEIQTHESKLILCVLLRSIICLWTRRDEWDHLLFFVNDAQIIRWFWIDFSRCFRVHKRLVVLNDIQSLFLARFNDALKASRRMLFFAVDAFFMIVYCSAFVRRMLVRAEITFDVVTTSFADVIVLLITKALLKFAFFFQNIRMFDENNHLTSRF
jgi:hypothetical protein